MGFELLPAAHPGRGLPFPQIRGRLALGRVEAGAASVQAKTILLPFAQNTSSLAEWAANGQVPMLSQALPRAGASISDRHEIATPEARDI